MLTKYLHEAMKRARYEIIDHGREYYGEIRGFKGVYASATTLEGCREQLSQILEEWVLFRVSRNLPLPRAGRVELRIRKVA